MNSVIELLRQLRGAGFKVYPEGQFLAVEPIPGRDFTDQQRRDVVRHKDAILQHVRVEAFRRELQQEIDATAAVWVEGAEPDLQVIAAEAELDRAARMVELDLDTALYCLRRWGECWRWLCIKAGRGEGEVIP